MGGQALRSPLRGTGPPSPGLVSGSVGSPATDHLGPGLSAAYIRSAGVLYAVLDSRVRMR
jgi:hypothetical protein